MTASATKSRSKKTTKAKAKATRKPKAKVEVKVEAKSNAQTSTTDSSGGPPDLSDSDRKALLDSARDYLKAGQDLKSWWDDAHRQNQFEEKFDLSESPRHSDTSFGFFDAATVQGKEVRVMGTFQSMFFDQVKAPGGKKRDQAKWVRDQLREFVLHYYLRTSGSNLPRRHPDDSGRSLPPLLRPFSWKREETASDEAPGYFQCFTKAPGNAAWKETPSAQQAKISDLRQLGNKIDLLVLWSKIFDFAIDLAPFGAAGPSVSLPLQESSYLVMNKDWVIAKDNPEKGILGHYGFGYALAKEPEAGFHAYSPGELDAAFEFVEFRIHRNGKIQVDTTFVSNLPDRLLDVSLDPISWLGGVGEAALGALGAPVLQALNAMQHRSPFRGFRVDPISALIRGFNLATMGQAESRLSISRTQLLKEFLLKHFNNHFHMVTGSLRTWRQFPNWRSKKNLPAWVKKGTRT